jgi:homoserine dehydrogenase
VLSRIASAFAEASVSICAVRQEGRGDRAMLIIVTHAAPEAQGRRAVESLRQLDVVQDVAAVLRVVGEGE